MENDMKNNATDAAQLIEEMTSFSEELTMSKEQRAKFMMFCGRIYQLTIKPVRAGTGRQWTAEQRETHGKLVKNYWDDQRASQKFIFRVGNMTYILTGWDQAALNWSGGISVMLRDLSNMTMNRASCSNLWLFFSPGSRRHQASNARNRTLSAAMSAAGTSRFTYNQ